MSYDAAMPDTLHVRACSHLLRHIRAGTPQEELCFALWRPATGATRSTALVFDLISPLDGERRLHGNASFEADYLGRAVMQACSQGVGLAFMHSHLSAGWQDMSDPDVVAERDRIAPPARATGLPLLGLTLGTDGSWSARFWRWDGSRFNRAWCDKVRVVGRRLLVTFNDRNMPPPPRRAQLRRTIDTWGVARQRDIARVHIGVVGLGSVGSMVAEALARIGVRRLTLIDPDKVELHNLDRLLHAGEDDVGRLKVDLVAQHLKNSATAAGFDAKAVGAPVQRERAYLDALDCDVLVSAVDRPLPKDLVNRIAYAHCIPVIFGGVFIDNKPDGALGQAAWSVVAVGPDRRCLRCDGQYTSSDVAMERDGSLDDPAYIRASDCEKAAPTNQNVFPFSTNLASMMVMQLVRLLIEERWWPDAGGKLHYSLIPNQLVAEQRECHTHCSVSEQLALGDRFHFPFIVREADIPADSVRPALYLRLWQWLKSLVNSEQA